MATPFSRFYKPMTPIWGLLVEILKIMAKTTIVHQPNNSEVWLYNKFLFPTHTHQKIEED